MCVVKELLEVTKQISLLLEHKIIKETREKLIKDIERLLEQRDNLIGNLPKTYSEEDLTIGKEIVRLNVLIEEKLEVLFQDIQVDIRNVKQTKKTSKKYTNPYENLSSDGMFFDKRK